MRRFFGLMLLAASVCGTMESARLEAGMLVVKLGGITGDGASSSTPATTLNGSPLAAGLAWTLTASFDTANLSYPFQDNALGPASSATLQIGPTTYSLAPLVGLKVSFRNYGAGPYGVGIESQADGINSVWVNVSTAGYPTNPMVSTTFSQIAFFSKTSMTFTTSQGTLILRAQSPLSPSAEIIAGTNAVPEPSVIGLAVCGSVCGLVVARRRRN